MDGENGRSAHSLNEPKPRGNVESVADDQLPPEMDDKVWADVEKAKLWAKVWREVISSPNTGKIVEQWLAKKDGTAKTEAETRLGIARLQAQAAFRSHIFFGIALVLCLVFLGLVIYWLRADKETLLPVLSAVIALIAGTGGGYVFGRNTVTGQ